MSRRFPTAERREQIISATLELLSRLPVQQVTTRAIAEEVGISQPALFRHFSSRAAILAAVIERSRDVLRAGAQQALESEASWADTAEVLVGVIVSHVTDNPGLPRLLFHDLSAPGGTPAHSALLGLVEMQIGLITGLITEGKRTGEVPPGVDAIAAGRLFAATVQGAMARWLWEPNPTPDIARDAARMWAAGVRAGIPAGAPAGPVPDASPKEALIALDIRPLLSRGEEPLGAILEAVERMRADGLMMLTAPFSPAPLLILLKKRGLHTAAEELGAKHWEISIRGPICPQPIDARAMEAPEPMEAVLFATAGLGADAVVIARLPRLPRLLFPRLRARELCWSVLEQADKTTIIHIRRSK